MDPIADMLTIIKNAILIGTKSVVIPSSKIKIEILKIFKQYGYISDWKINQIDKKNFIEIKLKYQDTKPVITQIRRISKPSLRIYSNYQKIPRSLGGIGRIIVSTPQGIMEGENARRKKLGGELICEIN